MEKEKGKKTGNIAEKIRELALPLCREQGLFLWDVRFEKEGAEQYLRVFIDKDGGVDMDDCERFSREFNKVLDEVDPISVSYVFECGSPGLGRMLRRPEHFLSCIGDQVRVKTIRPDENGERETVGRLVSYQNKQFVIELPDGNNKDFDLSECSSVKLNDDEDLF